MLDHALIITLQCRRPSENDKKDMCSKLCWSITADEKIVVEDENQKENEPPGSCQTIDSRVSSQSILVILHMASINIIPFCLQRKELAEKADVVIVKDAVHNSTVALVPIART